MMGIKKQIENVTLGKSGEQSNRVTEDINKGISYIWMFKIKMNSLYS